MGKATLRHKKEMERIIHWVLITANKGLKIAPKVEYNEDGKVRYILKGICDAAWNSYRKDGLSITGFVIFFMDVAIAWRSKAQRHVTLSSTEAEYVSISDVVKEILFIKQLLGHMGYDLELPIKVHVDNVGAIFMSRSNVNSITTRHVNMRYHFIRELVENETIEIIFIKTKENVADLFTKNLSSVDFERHASTLVEEVKKNVCD